MSLYPFMWFWTVKVNCKTCGFDFKLLSPLINGILFFLIPLIIGYLFFTYFFNFHPLISLSIASIIGMVLHVIYLFKSVELININKLNKKLLSLFR
jgi:F0F1-type ATP synthase assembly protein I